MKKIKLCLGFLLCATVLLSCVDTEEYIVVNADHSGSYTMKMDMGKMLEMMSQLGGEKTTGRQSMPKMDTVIYFKDNMASDKLTAAEKELYLDGYFKVKVDSATNEFKVEIGCPFKSIAQLPEIRKNIFKVSDKLGIDKAMGNKEKSSLPGTDESMQGDDLAGTLNPSAKDYNFTAVPGKISYKSNKPAGSTMAAGDSMMQMMQQLTMLTGDMTIKTVITLPNEPKKIGNPNAVLSADKRTITFSYSLTDLLEKPGEGEYEIEY